MTFTKLASFLVPFVPFLTRGFLCLRFRSKMLDHLGDKELAREAHRSHILTLAGFSFAGLLALVVLERTLAGEFRFGVLYLLLSFLGFLAALNTQSYKSTRLQDQFGTALMELGSFGLILSVVVVLRAGQFGSLFTGVLCVLAVSVWGIDHLFRIRRCYGRPLG